MAVVTQNNTSTSLCSGYLGIEGELLDATYAGLAGTVEQLLAAGCYADTSDSDGQPLLYIAAKLGHFNTVRALVRFGADVDRQNPHEHMNTALHIACHNGDAELGLYLVDSGAAVDSLNIDQQTPLQLAAKRGFKTVVQVLIGRGADIRKKDRFGQSAVDYMNVSHLPNDTEQNISADLISDRQLRHLFNTFDVNEDKLISVEEMQKCIRNMEHFGCEPSDNQIEAMVSQVSPVQGKLDFTQFSALILKLSAR